MLRPSFLDAFEKLRKVTISYVMSVCLFVRTEQLGSHWTDFYEILYFNIIRKSVEKSQISLKSDENIGYFIRRLMNIFIISRSICLRMRNISDKVVQKITTHILRSVTFFENRAISEIMWKYSENRTGHRWQYGTRVFHAWYLRLQTHTQNMQYLLPFYCSNGCTKAPQCHVIRILSVLFAYILETNCFQFDVFSTVHHSI